MKLKQKKITNMFKLSLTCMEGDADGFKTGFVLSPQFQGTYLEELTSILTTQIKRARKGLSGRDSEKLYEKSVELVGKMNHFLQEAANSGAGTTGQDCAADFLCNLEYGYFGPGEEIRDPYSLELSYFDDQGDEFTVFLVDEKGRTDY